jgi:hypothetical protein
MEIYSSNTVFVDFLKYCIVNRAQWKIGCNKCKPRNRRWYLVPLLMMKFGLPGFKISKCYSHRIIYREADLLFSLFLYIIIYLSLLDLEWSLFCIGASILSNLMASLYFECVPFLLLEKQSTLFCKFGRWSKS